MSQAVAVINLIIGLIGFFWFFWRTHKRWDEYPDEIQMLFKLTLALFFCLLAVSASILYIHNTLNNVVLVILLTKIYVLFTLWKTRDTKYRTGKRIKIPFNRDVNKDVL